ncbi:hypothetical protein ACFLUJ_08830 [Chloroflexota bacterium]
MARWAYEVRLDANDPRRAGEDAPLPTEADVQKYVDVAQALGRFLFVLPARVKRGLGEDTPDTTVEEGEIEYSQE